MWPLHTNKSFHPIVTNAIVSKPYGCDGGWIEETHLTHSVRRYTVVVEVKCRKFVEVRVAFHTASK